MNWTTLIPEVPDSLDGLSAAELRSLAAEAAKAIDAAPLDLSDEDAELWEQTRQLAIRLKARAELRADNETASAEEEEAEEPNTEASTEEEEAEEEEEEEETEEPNTEASASLSLSTTETITQTLTSWQAPGSMPGHAQGEPFETNRDLAEAVIDAARAMGAGASSRVEVAKMFADFGGRENATLSTDGMANLALFDELRDNPEALAAACCAPNTPLYDLACENTTRRPVKTELPQFRTPERCGYSVMPSPGMLETGFGQWTCEDDQDPEAIKGPCATIECSDPVDFELYAVWACMKVKNMLQMCFPELVDAYMNRLMAARARFAETLLLEAMANSADVIAAPSYGFNANVELKRVLLTYLGLYREEQRWDDALMDGWMPRWLLNALKMDAVSRRSTNGTIPSVPSTESINSIFRDVGVEPHWYLDRPSWATPLPTLATGGAMNVFPSSVEILIHRRGKFAVMDRGDLTIGVAPNNLYRTQDDLERNQVTMFFESFEGVIDTDSCPAHIIEIPDLCFTGHQIGDVTPTDMAIACDTAAPVS